MEENDFGQEHRMGSSFYSGCAKGRLCNDSENSWNAILVGMKPPPKSVIHINFDAGPLIFDARPIWAALMKAEKHRKIPVGQATELMGRFGETAIHLGTRHYLMKQAIGELKAALLDVYNLIPEPWSIESVRGYRIVKGGAWDRVRDRAILAIEMFLYEFRTYLDLLAQFVHGVLISIGKGTSPSEKLSSGNTVAITDRKGKLRPHGFLLYLCDKLGLEPDWYTFLSTHRNFFTHQGAPYIAIEDLLVRPPVFDLIVLKANIHDFGTADPSSYFRSVRVSAGRGRNKIPEFRGTEASDRSFILIFRAISVC
jgi:hypothetical protein